MAGAADKRSPSPHSGRLLSVITQHYLKSSDFNGYSLHRLRYDVDLSEDGALRLVTELVGAEKIDVISSGMDENPHVRRWPDKPTSEQIAELQQNGLRDVCAYPSAHHLEGILDRSAYDGRPFTLELALGQAQLSFRAFDCAVLEYYRNDPRYNFTNSDISGRICISDEFYEQASCEDRVSVETFGYAHDPEGRRVVVVFLRYLHKLTSKHQQVWQTHLVKGDFVLHPDYRRITLGSWDLGRSIFDAFLEEIREVNRISGLIGRPRLFLHDFPKRPDGFGFLTRPTKKAFDEFVCLLDKMMSDNINRKFFLGEVTDFNERLRADGMVEKERKGTIQLLQEWLHARFHMEDSEPLDEVFKTFRDTRNPRSRIAHEISHNKFDEAYMDQQRDLMKRAYSAVWGLRLAFQSHPMLRGYQAPKHLDSARIYLN